MRLRWHDPAPPVAVLLATWMDSWRGVGAVLAGMTAQGFNVELKEFPKGWRANFYPVGIAHSVVAGSAYEPTACRAVQRAGWEGAEPDRGQRRVVVALNPPTAPQQTAAAA